jgi:hypothetical protein
VAPFSSTPYGRRSTVPGAAPGCWVSGLTTCGIPARLWSTGATVKDLMRRLGHASPAAANRYLYTVAGRDAEVTSALSDLAAHGDAARLPKSIVNRH